MTQNGSRTLDQGATISLARPRAEMIANAFDFVPEDCHMTEVSRSFSED